MEHSSGWSPRSSRGLVYYDQGICHFIITLGQNERCSPGRGHPPRLTRTHLSMNVRALSYPHSTRLRFCETKMNVYMCIFCKIICSSASTPSAVFNQPLLGSCEDARSVWCGHTIHLNIMTATIFAVVHCF